jgi:hypothetical protein
MKLYFLTALSLLFFLTAAQPVMKCEGSSPIACPRRVQAVMTVNVVGQVDEVFTNSGENRVRRQLRGNGEGGRELLTCQQNGCNPGNGNDGSNWQYCQIIGCSTRRELQDDGSSSPMCPTLVAAAQAKYDAQAAAQRDSNLPNANECAPLTFLRHHLHMF